VSVRPYYVSVRTNVVQAPQVPEYRGVIVTYEESSVLAGSIGDALAALFPGFDGDVGDNVSGGIDGPIIVLGSDAEEVLVQIDELLREADAARNAGDLALLQEKLDEVNELANDAILRFDLESTADVDAGTSDADDSEESDTEE
jgi:uncharacterized membrane protein (UPF0182 family)